MKDELERLKAENAALREEIERLKRPCSIVFLNGNFYPAGTTCTGSPRLNLITAGFIADMLS